MNKGGLHAECWIVNPKQWVSKYFLLSEGDVRPEVAASLPLSGGLSLSLGILRRCQQVEISAIFREKKTNVNPALLEEYIVICRN